MSMPAADAIDVLTFDCYGTLIDWATGIVRFIQPVLESYDAHVTDQFVLEFFAAAEPEAQIEGRSYADVLKEVFVALGGRLAFTPTETQIAGFVESVKAWPAFEDSAAALADLAGKAELVVVSNIDDDLLAASEETLGTTFDGRVTAQSIGAYKPSAKMFDAAEAIIDGRSHIHVAQSAFHDIVPATERGWRTAWIRRDASAAMALRASPTWAFDTLADFAAALEFEGG